MAKAKSLNLNNVNVITCDMNKFDPKDFGVKHQFERVLSVEMFEYMRNYKVLYKKIHDWLVPGGKFFMHIFVHRSTPYLFEVQGDDDWMGQYFFSGGMMPSDDLPLNFQEHLKIVRRWRWDGTHYEKTANAWLENMDKNRDTLNVILRDTYGTENAEKWRNRWRIFYMACAELFGYNKGQEWWVTHYQFERPFKMLIANFLLFQLAWFSCVVSAAYGIPWGGVAVTIMIMTWHLTKIRPVKSEIWLVFIAIAIGACFDQLNAYDAVDCVSKTWLE